MLHKNLTFANHLLLVFSLLLAALPASGAVLPAAAADLCAAATPLPPAGSERRTGGDGLFTVEAPAAGLLTVHVVAPGAAPAAPKLGFLGRDCRGSGWRDGVFSLEASVAGLVLAVEGPGTYGFRVGAQDPLLALASYKVVVGFAEAAASRASSEDEDDGTIEIEPDLVRTFSPGGGRGVLLARASSDDEDDGTIEIEPDLVRAPASWEELCRRHGMDDHGETPVCASRLVPGETVAAEIGNGWGDDADVFALVVSARRTFSIAASGGLDTFGGLYNRHGHRLAADDDGADGAGFRIVRTLTPGVYFVRVEGRGGAEGPYELRVETVGW